jgi:hypothetical protein
VPSPSEEEPARPRFTPLYLLGVALCAAIVMALRAAIDYPTQIFDFYPLYYGARAWLHGGNAYDISAVAPVADHWHHLYQVGNIYPLPIILLVLPFSFLTPKVAAIVWLGTLTIALLLALRLGGLPGWFALYFPVLNGLNLEQCTILILTLQVVALWAYQTRRPWILALCCALIVAKPNHGLIFALCLILLARQWRQQLIVGGLVWGGSLLLDPNWIVEWIPTLFNHHDRMHLPIFWHLAFFALPLLLIGNIVGGATMLQFAILPWPVGPYPAVAIPLTVLRDRWSIWLVPCSFLWPLLAGPIGHAWSTALTLMLPMALIASVRWWLNQRTTPHVGPSLVGNPQ